MASSNVEIERWLTIRTKAASRVKIQIRSRGQQGQTPNQKPGQQTQNPSQGGKAK